MHREMTFTFHTGEWDTAFELAYSMGWEPYGRFWELEGYEIRSPRSHNDLPAWMCKVLEKHLDIQAIIWEHWGEEMGDYDD